MKKRIYFLSLLLWGCAICIYAQENYTLDYSYFSNEEEGDYARINSIYYTDSADVVIPETVKHDGFTYSVHYITYGNGNYLRSISFPKGFVEIGYISFSNCQNLNKVVFNKDLKRIDRDAFFNCSKLSFIEIPASVSFIGYGAFTSKINGIGYGLKTAIIHCAGTFEYDDDKSYAHCHPFYPNTNLTTIIYTNPKAPENWVATTRTYVPDKEVYSSPLKNLTNTPHIIEMITFNENTFDYTGNTPNVTWTNNVEGYTASLDMPALKADAGTHVDTILATFIGEHPFTAKIPYRYTIKPVKLTAKVNNVSREYGEENPNFSISYSGFMSGDNENIFTTLPTVSTTATKSSNVGEYPITISGGVASNYEVEYKPGVLTIVKAPLSAQVADTSKVYGTANPNFKIKYYGLKNNETEPAWSQKPTFSTDAKAESGVGTYKINATNCVPVNYELGDITSGTLTITPANLTITANNSVRQYYEDNPNLKCVYKGFVNGDTEEALTVKPVLSTTATQTSTVGDYPIKVSGASCPNYEIAYVEGQLKITPRTLNVSVGNYERAYGEENPKFELTYEGFAGSENESSLTKVPKIATKATKTSDVGTYDITISDGEADNYEFNYSNGKLNITKVEQTLEWNQEFAELNIGDQLELTAKASSGLPITYTADNNTAIEIYNAGSKTYIDCKSAGQVVIRAVQSGNQNYYTSQRLSKSIIIKASSEKATQDVNNDGVVDTQDVLEIYKYIQEH